MWPKSGVRIIFIGLFCLSFPAFAQPLYKCIENGKTLITDKPCKTTKSDSQPGTTTTVAPVTQAQPDADASDPYGTWRGQAQYQATIKGQRIAEAHNVVDMTIGIDRKGKVTGESPANGCKLLGIAAPSGTRTVLYVDVSLSGCRYGGFNRRFSGTLAVYLREKHAQLSLHSFTASVPAQFDIKATMRR